MRTLYLLLFGLTLSCTPSTTSPAPSWQAPGAAPHGDDLAQALRDRWNNLPTDHEVRTRHLEDDGFPKFTNRLLLESSPYLRQHAHNPVDWYPWGPEAFNRAKELDRPVFLSVGYATCHWCHVMEEESFEDLEIAQYLNEHFVCIKVDREERPDVDSIYMTAVHAINGRGGWPMSVWMTSDAEPFFAGTYFPPRAGVRGSRSGFLPLLQRIDDAWRNKRDRITGDASTLSADIRKNLDQPTFGDLPGIEVMDRVAQASSERFDATFGGVGNAPKFPSSTPFRALLRQHHRTGDARSLAMVTSTLDAMGAGGMYDQVGGGFHRYSTDHRWLVPHFEKMLYDNALLVVIYLEAWQATGDASYADRVRDVLKWMREVMEHPDGGFYTATDADSADEHGRREEGLYFVWTPEQLTQVLGPERAPIVAQRWGVIPGGHMDGYSVLHEAATIAEVAAQHGISEEKVVAHMHAAREQLAAARDLRAKPLRDDKMLAAWNGLAISAFARAGLLLDEPGYVKTAERAASYVLAHHRADGKLHRSVKEGVPRHDGYMDDHAFVTAGLLDLFEATSDPRWLREAKLLDDQVRTRFEDPKGGWYYTANDHEQLLARERQGRDGAIPSGSSVHMLNLMRLGELTTDRSYDARAIKALKSQAQILARGPSSLSEAVLALDWAHARALEIVIVVPDERAQAAPMLKTVRERFLPHSVLVVVAESDVNALAALVPLVDSKVALDGLTTAYLCERGACQEPTSDPSVLSAQIDAWSPTR